MTSRSTAPAKPTPDELSLSHILSRQTMYCDTLLKLNTLHTEEHFIQHRLLCQKQQLHFEGVMLERLIGVQRQAQKLKRTTTIQAKQIDQLGTKVVRLQYLIVFTSFLTFCYLLRSKEK